MQHFGTFKHLAVLLQHSTAVKLSSRTRPALLKEHKISASCRCVTPYNTASDKVSVLCLQTSGCIDCKQQL